MKDHLAKALGLTLGSGAAALAFGLLWLASAQSLPVGLLMGLAALALVWSVPRAYTAGVEIVGGFAEFRW